MVLSRQRNDENVISGDYIGSKGVKKVQFFVSDTNATALSRGTRTAIYDSR